MTAVPYRPEEQVLKRIEERQRAEMLREVEGKVVAAKPPSGSVAFRPASENEKLKLAVLDKSFEPAVEAESKVLRASDRLGAGEQRVVKRVDGTELIAWRPDARDKQLITSRVERGWADSKRVEGLGVETTVRYLERTGEHTDFVRLGERNSSDVLCLAKDGKLCVVECKGHEVKAKDTGYIGANSDKAGTLATENKDGVFYENERQWLLKNKSCMKTRLQSRIDDPLTKPVERASCQRLLEVLNHTNFRHWDSHHRLVGVAGPEVSFGNVEDYVDKVKPEKMIQIHVPI